MALATARIGHQRRLYVDQTKETTWGTSRAGAGTVIADAACHVFDQLGDSKPPRIKQNLVDTAELATGYQGATRAIPLDREAPGELSMWLSTEALGIFGAYCLGADAVTTATLDNLHAITPAALTTLPAGLTIEPHENGSTYDSNTDHRHVGAAVTEIRVRGGRQGLATMRVVILGSGKVEAGANYTEANVTKPSVFFPAGKCRISMAAESSEGTSPWSSWTSQGTGSVFQNTLATDLSQHVDEWEFIIRQVIGATRSGGTSTTSGTYGAQGHVIRREAEFSCTWILDNTTDDFVKGLYNMTAEDNFRYAIQLEGISDVPLTNDWVSCGIVLPLAQMMMTPESSGGLDLSTERTQWKAHSPTAGSILDMMRIFVTNSETGDYCA